MSNMAVLRGAQLATSAFSDVYPCFQAALHAQEEPRSHAACSQRLEYCHKAGPKLALFHDSTPRLMSVESAVAQMASPWYLSRKGLAAEVEALKAAFDAAAVELAVRHNAIQTTSDTPCATRTPPALARRLRSVTL